LSSHDRFAGRTAVQADDLILERQKQRWIGLAGRYGQGCHRQPNRINLRQFSPTGRSGVMPDLNDIVSRFTLNRTDQIQVVGGGGQGLQNCPTG
jgi:hypothetical protein